MDEEVQIYLAIGNSDDKLSQARWAQYMRDIHLLISLNSTHIFGEWFSAPQSEYQNACYSFSLPKKDVDEFKKQVTQTRKYFSQDSVAWTEKGPEFL